ncbi:MAG: bifunctional 2-polyprenyl-6-hydroxyphenol methylase/3-demethylubiquinol 3-O-methyltransferase UbiG [Gammaproteobacteria bacterium]|nr:bifunctional 2-polyprenyl-6-hydroxyphenol methylase/3-demethylubiquinol 3-O-methyltransferase UbiG [Gammaproteobacteria bacterium]
MPPSSNVDPGELSKFDRLEQDWWDPRGPFRALHALNPVRLRFIEAAIPLHGRPVLDLGCGGGLLCEGLARRNAQVTGIDASASAIRAAQRHAAAGGLAIDYHAATAEEFAAGMSRPFDVVTCMELLEHVPDPAGLIAACARMLKPGGAFIASTINRNLLSFLGAVIAAEYVFGILPRGTHDYARFIRPSELSRWLRSAGFEIVEIAGLQYLPWLDRCALTNRPSVNYILHARLRD